MCEPASTPPAPLVDAPPAKKPLVLRAYKNRELGQLPADTYLDPGNAWYVCDALCAKDDAISAKYPGYTAYRASLSSVDKYSIMPAKAFIQGEFRGTKFGFNLEYKTVLARPPSYTRPSPNGFVMVHMHDMDVAPASVDYSKLDKKLWCQGKGGGLHILIQLELYTSYPGILMQDDATGEAYCYRPRQILVLDPDRTNRLAGPRQCYMTGGCEA